MAEREMWRKRCEDAEGELAAALNLLWEALP